MYSKIIGQKLAISKLETKAAVFTAKKATPMPAILAPYGCGKSTILQAFAKSVPDAEMFYYENPNELRSQEDFAAALKVWQHASNKGKIIVAIDEAHLIVDKGQQQKPTVSLGRLQNMLMQIALAAQQGKQSIVCNVSEDNSFIWQAENCLFTLATNYWDKFDEAFRSRWDLVNLQVPTESELEQILMMKLAEKNLRQTEETAEAVRVLVNVCSQSPRLIDTLTANLADKATETGKSSISKKDVLHVMRESGLYPFGFHRDFVIELSRISKGARKWKSAVLACPNVSPKNLAAMFTRAEDKGFFVENSAGKTLSPKGKRALETWHAEGFRW